MSAVGVLSAAVIAPLFALLTVMSVDMPDGRGWGWLVGQITRRLGPGSRSKNTPG
jgi:hypothetical protein